MILALTLILAALLPCLTVADSKKDRHEFNVGRDHFARQEATPTFPDNSLPPARTGTSTQPSGTPILIFGVINPLVTCELAPISWTFAGPAAPITLTITNAGVEQGDPPTSSGTGNTAPNTFTNTDPPIPGGGVGGPRTRAARAEPNPEFIITTIATSLDPTLEHFTWPKVTVPQGWYTVLATFTDTGHLPKLSAGARPFFVQNGTDVSCLATLPTGSPSTPTSSGQGSENTSAPAGAAHSHVNAGAIAGGVVGGVALLAIVAAVLLCLRYRRNKAGVFASTSGDGEGGNSKSDKPGFLGTWGKLGSGSFNDKAPGGLRGNGAGNEAIMSAVGQKASGSDSSVAKSGLALAAGGFSRHSHQRSRSKSGGSPTASTNAASSDRSASAGVVGSVAGFFGARKTSSSPPPVGDRKSGAKKPYYSNSRHNSHTESIGGMLSSTSTMTSSSAFHGADDDYAYNLYDERGLGVPLSTIPDGGSATSSVRDRDHTATSHGPPAFRSPFSDPETATNDSDSVVYGLHGTTHTHRDSSGVMGVIPIAYNPSSIAPSPSPVPSSNLHYDSATSSAGAVAGHSSLSSDSPSRRNSRGNRLHSLDDSSNSTTERERARTQSHSYSAFRDRDSQRGERERAQTLLTMYHPNSPLPHSSTPQSVPETPQNDSLLTFTSSSSSDRSSKKHRSKSMRESSTELYEMPAEPIPMQATSSQPNNESTNTFGRSRRKPVPSYSLDDASYFTAPTDPTPTHKHHNASASSIPSPVSPATPVSPISTHETAASSHEGKHRSNNIETISEGQVNVYRQHELFHKDSAGSLKGGKQMMHVLIPDMPPPPRG